MKIGLDFDGVITNCGKFKSDAAERLFDLNIPPDKFKKEIVIGEGHLTAEQYRQFQKTIYGTRELSFLMEPVEGVLEYVPKLLNDGHTLSIITSREGHELEIPQEWLRGQGLELPLMSTGYGKSKADAAVGLDVYIDDDFDKLEPLIGVVPHRFLFSWGYNQHIEIGTVAKRIASWEEFYATIRNLASS